jgi:hypothetical protein
MPSVPTEAIGILNESEDGSAAPEADRRSYAETAYNFNLNDGVNTCVTPAAHHQRCCGATEKAIPMKLVVTFDFPDRCAPLAVMLEASIRDSVKEFNRNTTAANVTVHRVRLLTDKHWREQIERIYAPRGRAGLIRRWTNKTPLA